MSSPARVLSGRGRKTALIVGAMFLLGAAAALLAYVASFGLDGFSGYGLVVVALATVMLGSGASSRPLRWGVVRITVGLLCLASLVILAIFGFAATNSNDSDNAGGLLFLTGLLLVPVAPCVTIVGRPDRDQPPR